MKQIGVLVFLMLVSGCEIFGQPYDLKTASIKIITANKQYDRESSTYDSTAATIKDFKGWNLTAPQILHILKSSEPISGTEWDLKYSVLPFWYKGELLINGIRARYSLNAASFVIIQYSDTTIYIGCNEKRLHSYFMDQPESGKIILNGAAK